MRYRMLVVAIGLMVLVATSVAFAQLGDADNDGDTALAPVISQADLDAARKATQEAEAKARAAEDKLSAAESKLGVSAQQMGEMRGQLTKTEGELAKLKGLKAQKQQQLNTHTRTAIRTGRKADWHRVGVTANELKALEAKVSALESQYHDTQKYLHNGGYFAEMQQNAGFITRSQADKLYTPKTPAIAPAPVATPATPGKTITAPAQTPANKESKPMEWNSALGGIIIALGIIALVYLCYLAGRATLVRATLTNLTDRTYWGRYNSVSVTVADGVVKITGEGVIPPAATP